MDGFGSVPGYLDVKNGALTGMSFPLQGSSIMIGKKEDNNIVIPDPMISGHHARVDVGPDGIILTDLGSSNGTIVNGVKIQSHILREGDTLFLGSTEMTFRGESAALPASSDIFPAPLEAVSKTRSKMPLIIGSIVGLFIIIGALVIALVVMRGKEAAKDITPPEVDIVKPESGKRFELPIYDGGTVDVDIEIKASDDRKINKVELFIDGEKVTVFTKEDSPPYKHKFNASQPGDYSVYATAFDEAGNSGDSDHVVFSVWLDSAKKMAVNAYVTQLDACVMEFNQYRSTLNGLVGKGKGIKQSVDPIFQSDKWSQGWLEVYQGTEAISNNLSSLQGKAGALNPPGEFSATNGAFVEAVTSLKKCSDYAKQWAQYSYLSPYSSSADAYLNQYNREWQVCDSCRARFNSLYEEACLAILRRPPYAKF
jgi:hypothetical protein